MQNKDSQTELVSLYAAQEKIYPRSTFGFFTKWRWVLVWLTQLFLWCALVNVGRQTIPTL